MYNDFVSNKKLYEKQHCKLYVASGGIFKGATHRYMALLFAKFPTKPNTWARYHLL